MTKQPVAKDQLQELNKWFIFPEQLNGDGDGRFIGYQTRDDITQIRGGFPVGQNIIFTASKTPTVRAGSQLIGTAVVTPHAVKRAWNFERRDGTEIDMKTYDTGVYFRIEGVMTDYQLLEGGYTADKEFCYGVISKATSANSQVMFCNGVEEWRKWTGLYGLYASDDGINVITISGSLDVSALGFPATGTLSYKGTAITYTGIAGKTFTGCSAVPSALGAVVGDVIADFPVQVTGSSVLKSSVGYVHDARIFARNETAKSVAVCSKIDDPTDWTVTASTDGSGDIKDIEQGGPITAFCADEKQVYIFKKRLIKTLEFVSNNVRIDIAKYGTPKPSNDKSTTIGAVGQKSTFAGPNGVFFVTTDKQLIYLYRQDFKDYPQQMDIADPIRPTFSAGVHDDAAGIVYNSKVYYAYKQDSHSTYNDTVIIYDLIRNIWSTPVVGWNVSDWSVINGNLRWHSSVSPDTYELTNDQLDGDVSFTTILRTWNEIFTLPEWQKKIDYVMVEIYLQENSEVTATVLYNENGHSGQEEFVLRGSDTRFRLGASNYNPFGATPFGEERFGSNPDVSGMNKYRFFLELKGNVEFYSIALQLSTNTENCNYEFIRFGYHITQLIKLLDINYMVSPDNSIDNLNL